MIRKTLTTLTLLAGLTMIPAHAQSQTTMPNFFNLSAVTNTTAAPNAGTMNFMDHNAWMSMFSGQPLGGPQFNLATPGGWTVFMNPSTYGALMNPATYEQFMKPNFYMQFANPTNWMSWMDPAAYGPWMNPMTYTQMMNPMAYMSYMNPNTYMQWINPAAYGLAATSENETGALNFFDPNNWMNFGQQGDTATQ